MAWALITGASSGFGRDFARLAALEGYDLILTARRREPMEALAAEFTAAGRANTVEIITADLSQPDAAQALWAKASEGREIELLVNNAGLGTHGLHGDNPEAARALVAVNVTAANELAMAAMSAFRTKGTGGKILMVASLAAYFPAPTMAAYHASKAFMLNLSNALNIEGKPDRITVTAFCPGATETGFFDAAAMGETWLTRMMPPADSAKLAEMAWRGMMRGRRNVIPGIMPNLTAFASRFLPGGLSARLNQFFWTETGE